MGRLIDLTGESFGRWTVINRADDYYTGNTKWNCVCSCGIKRVVMSPTLRRGESQSCGCLRDELRTGENSPGYKGGLKNRGSLAYFNNKVAGSRCSARSGQYKPLALTGTELVELYAGHNQCCDGCGIRESELKRGLFVDHDHATGEFRAWLCKNCNFVMGHAKDDPSILLTLARLLQTEKE